MNLLVAGNSPLAGREDKTIEEALRESEERFRGAFEFAAIGMALVAPDGRWRKVNRSLCRITGYTEPELLGLTFQDITHPDDLEPDLALTRQVLAGEIPWYHLEKRYIHKDGHVVWILLSVSLVRDREGQPCYFVAQMQDISEQKAAAEALRRQQALLENVITHIPCAVFWKDRDSVFLGANEQCARNLGLPSPRDLVGKTDHDLHLSRQEADFYVQCDRQVMATGLPLLNIEEVQHRPDGTKALLLTSKVPLRDAEGEIVGTIGIYTDITQRKATEEALRESEQRYRDLFENAADVVYTHDLSGAITSVNIAAERLTGYSRAELLRMNFTDLVSPRDLERCREMIQAKLDGACRTTYEVELRVRDGSRRVVEVTSRVIWRDGKPEGIQGIARDLTDRKRLEEQLRQAQKMDAVGQLAAGVAHDFNNLLTVINGYSDMLLHSLPSGNPLRELLEPIKKAGEQSAMLTRKLLAFSRKQVVAPIVLDLNQVVAEMNTMLRRTLGEDIELTTRLQAQLGLIKADPGQLEQLLLNLAVNARDAMPQGGQLAIETSQVELDEGFAQVRAGARPGPYVLLAVSDTGCGMSEEVRCRIFEPFFTTKEIGKGTGLGLSTVYAIVQNSQGHIDVYSEPGLGTCFKIYLPRHHEPLEEPPHAGALPAPVGHETVLLVEDDAGVRSLVRDTLKDSGYTVLDAANGREALALVQQHRGPLDLLVTDVIMPGLGGRQLAEQLLARFPDMKVLYMSGYTDDAVVRYGILQEHVHFLQKPFALPVLGRKIREVLDAGK